MHIDVASAAAHFEREGHRTLRAERAVGLSGRMHPIDLVLADPERSIVSVVDGNPAPSHVLRTAYAARDIRCNGVVAFDGEASETVRNLAHRYGVQLEAIEAPRPAGLSSWRASLVT